MYYRPKVRPWMGPGCVGPTQGWHGPHVDEEGREYFANSDLGISSWSDPRHATQQLGGLRFFFFFRRSPQVFLE